MNRQKLACLGLVLSIFSVMSSVYAQTPTVYPRLDARIATPLESEASVTETNAGALPLRTLAAPTATWVQSTGPETANPFAFLRRGQRLFQGNFGGLWFSDDNGDNWTRQINNGLLIGRGVTALAASNTTLFLGTNFGGTGGGVYRSTNEGQTWTAINNGFPAPRSIQDFLVNGVNVFAITFNGELFRSTDNGDNWTRINNGLPSAVSVGLGGGFTITNNAILLRNGAENPAAIYRSTDNGANWTKLDLQLPASVLLLNLVANSSKTFLGTTQGLLSSIDGGQSWQSVSGLPTPGSGQGLAPYLSGTTVYVSLVSFSDPNGESTTYISTDNGLTWAQKSKVPFSQIYEILVEGPTVFFGTPNGVVRTNDSGASYEIKNKGLRAAFTWSDVVVLGNRIYVSSHGGGLWLTTDHGATWKQLKNGLPYYAFVSAVRAVGNTLYAALEQPFGFYHSTDFGETWTPLGKGLPSADFTSFPTVLTNNDGKLYLGFDNKGLWVSSDNGENFAQVAGGLPNNAWVWSLAFKDNAIFVATNGTSLFRSTDGGVSFSTSNTGLPALFTRGLLATGNFLFLTTGSGVFRSADNGTTWTPSLTNAFYNTIARSGSAIYVASSGAGCYSTRDNGTTWQVNNTGLFGQVSRLATNGSQIILASQGSGVFFQPEDAFATVSAASYNPLAITEKTIVAAFGNELASSTAAAASVPLPTTLAGTSIKVRDASGVERQAPLFFVSSGQINYQIPAGTANGAATITISTSSGATQTSVINVVATAPAIFTLNAQGTGAAAALDAIKYTVGPFDAKQANGEPNILAVFGTGLGGDATDVSANVNAAVTARLNGAIIPTFYAGTTPGIVGLNQFNIQLPANITAGTYTLTFTRGGVTSNTVTITIR